MGIHTDFCRVLIACTVEIFLCALATNPAGADSTTADKIKLMLAARDVCTGIFPKFANTPDTDGEISYDQGKFKVVRAKSSVTVFEDNVQLAQVSKFDFANYNLCVEKLTAPNQ